MVTPGDYRIGDGPLGRVPMEALAVVAARIMTLGEVLTLARDATLDFPHDGRDAARLEVDGVAVAAGMVVVDAGRITVRIAAA